MNKTELIAAMAEKNQLSKKDNEAALASFMEAVKDVMRDGDKIQLVGFGTFEAVPRAERQGRNPSTGAVTVIPATTVARFKPGQALKDAAAEATKKKGKKKK